MRNFAVSPALSPRRLAVYINLIHARSGTATSHKMTPISVRHYPPENEQDFERLCLLLLRENWTCPDLQMYGRRGQRQNGIDIVDLGGAVSPRGAQCKNFNPLETLSPDDVIAAVEEAKSFQPALCRFEILTTAKKSTTTQNTLGKINREHREKNLFGVRLKTWDEIELLLGRYPAVSEQVYGGGLLTAINELGDQVRSMAAHIESLIGQIQPAATEVSRPQFNRVLVRWQNRLVEQTEGERKVAFQDFSIVLLTIEELVSLGAMEMALDFTSGEFPSLVERLPNALQDRVEFVGDPGVRANVEAILSPVYEEFGVESLHGGYSLQFELSVKPEVSDSVGVVWGSLYDFLIGAKNYLQIDIDLNAFLSAVRQLRRCSRSTASRANLAVIEGILSTYEGQKVDCIGLRSSESGQAVSLFNRFAGLDDYKALSQAAQYIGFPRHVRGATNSFSMISQKLVHSRELGRSLELGSRRILASRGFREDDPLNIVRPSPEGFLPPIISFASARARALEMYKQMNPEPLVHDAVKKHLTK